MVHSRLKLQQSTFLLYACFALCCLSGCLSVEKKIYKITLKTPTTGTCSIEYVNITSNKDNERDVSFKDFAELTTDYLEGDKIDIEYPDVTITKRELFDKNNQLCGVVEFEFDSLSPAKLFKYDANSPYMMMIAGTNEQFLETNGGKYGGEAMPVMFWPTGSRSLHVVTTLSEESKEGVSMMKHYKKWKSANK